MADAHPYISSTGAIVQATSHFRKSMPQTIEAATLQKLGIAPNNESYLINTLRFIGVIDEDGNVRSEARKLFSHHNDEEFSKELAAVVKSAYQELFQLHGEGAWALEDDKLITFFRSSDQSSDIVGRRQAKTFRTLASLAGHGEAPKPNLSAKAKVRPRKEGKNDHHTSRLNGNTRGASASPTPPVTSSVKPPLGLTVRIEINLPADGSQETYDTIFKSIRQNLLR